MESRRKFLRVSAAALAAKSVLGANDRVRVGLIGCGRRGAQIRHSLAKLPDCVFAAACDVDKPRLDRVAAAIGGKVDVYADYRRILERKDIDAVIVATPDHWHAPMLIDACDAGKDVYLEKPVSNALEPALKMLAAARKSKRVIQVGCQQRSWSHFQEWAKKVQEGCLGQLRHCILVFEGGGGRGRRTAGAQNPPAGLDWEAWQGPAERRPYTPERHRGWRSYYDYGGGTITDWGVHLADVMTWYTKTERRGPQLTSAAALYLNSPTPDLSMAPDTYSVTWKYENFVATFTNATLPSQNPEMMRSDAYGNYFYGRNGVVLVNRFGYAVMPARQQGGAPGGGSAQALTATRQMDPNGMDEAPESKFAEATTLHGRDFLDSVKSRKQPCCDFETGFYSSLPCLLAVMAIRQGRSIVWDGETARPA